MRQLPLNPTLRPNRGNLDVTPMMMVPVFVLLIAGFAFMAVRNEMIKDDIRDIEKEVINKKKTLETLLSERPRRMAAEQLGFEKQLASAKNRLKQRQEDIHRMIEEQAEQSKLLGVETSKADGMEARVAEERRRCQELLETQEELRTKVSQAVYRGAVSAAIEPAPGRPVEPPPPPYQGLFAAAEVENAIVMRRYGLAVTNIKIQPIAQEVKGSVGAILDVPRDFSNRVQGLYSEITRTMVGPHDQQYAAYLVCKDMHSDLSDFKTRRLKELKAAIDELTKIESDTNKAVKKAGYDVTYVSPYVAIIEGQRKSLRDSECKPPAEPTKQYETR